MKKKLFAQDVEKPKERLLAIATKRFPGRSWTLFITLWDDGDYQLELVSSRHSEDVDKFVYMSYDNAAYYVRLIDEVRIPLLHERIEWELKQ